MKSQQVADGINTGVFSSGALQADDIFTPGAKISEDYQNLFQQLRLPWLNELLTKLATSTGKKSFLVFKNNKYVNVPTENIAFFYVNYESSAIMCFDKQEYFVTHSLDQIQSLLPQSQFFRINRQYIIHIEAIQQMHAHSKARVRIDLAPAAHEEVIVSTEKSPYFKKWLEGEE